MMGTWTSSLRVSPREASLLIEDTERGDLLKARLPPSPRHPRALLTLLEGAALWCGQPMRVVLSAADSSMPWVDPATAARAGQNVQCARQSLGEEDAMT
jgi:hypothetical protein